MASDSQYSVMCAINVVEVLKSLDLIDSEDKFIMYGAVIAKAPRWKRLFNK